jgi:hypothetical protein
MSRDGIVGAICLVFATVVSGVLLERMPAGGVRAGGRGAVNSALVREWRDAVLAGKERRALALASKIVGKGDVPGAAPREYVDMCRENGVAPAFLDSGFNHWDFQLWSDAFFFKRLAVRSTESCEDSGRRLKALFDTVCERVEVAGLPTVVLPWPRDVWRLGKGLCDRQSWVLCELAYQAGYDAWIVYLMTPGTTVSPHTICEIRKGGSVWVADPFSRKLLPGKSVADLAESPDLAKSFWPDRADWRKAIVNPNLFLPAYPQDYCWKNQRLDRETRAVLGDDAPAFGESPGIRLRSAADRLDVREKKLRTEFWFFPFRLLRTQMIRSIAERRNGDVDKSGRR